MVLRIHILFNVHVSWYLEFIDIDFKKNNESVPPVLQSLCQHLRFYMMNDYNVALLININFLVSSPCFKDIKNMILSYSNTHFYAASHIIAANGLTTIPLSIKYIFNFDDFKTKFSDKFLVKSGHGNLT